MRTFVFRGKTAAMPIYSRYYSVIKRDKPLSINVQNNEIGLGQFVSKVYTKMGLGVTVTLGSSLGMFSLIPSMLENPFVPFGVGAIASFASVYGITKIKPEYKSENKGREVVHFTKNPLLREASFWGLSLGMGIMMAPFMGMIMSIDPMIVPASLGLSTFIFGGCALYARNTTNTKIMEWKAPLFFGLTSLIGLQIIGIGSTFFFGQNGLSTMIHNVDIYGGIGLFTLMSIYDSYMAKQMYLEGKADHLGCATTVYLDFMNLLIRIMEALAKAKKD